MYQIIIEPTENPKVLKFIAKHTLIEGSLELERASDISEIPIAQELFRYPFITRIFITANFIAVAKEDTVEWETVVQSLKDVIENTLLAYPKIFSPSPKKQYTLYAEMTPNPSVMKFVSNKLLLEGFLEAKNLEESEDIPLAKTILQKLNYIKEVFISDNFVALTKIDKVQWHEVMMDARKLIIEYLQTKKPISNIPANQHKSPVQKIINRNYTNEEQRINDILNEYIAPAVENDGGKISLIEYDKDSKTAKMLLQGACSGCPSSTATLKNGIERILKQFVPDLVNNVEAING